MKRLATLVGCNYPNEVFQLQGCANDVKAIRQLLIERFEFKGDNIQVLTDDSEAKPTGDNIKRALRRMVNQAENGDILYFHFSGCGTLADTESGPKQAIVPCDFKLINSKFFRDLVDLVPTGVNFTFTCDSSFSGGLIHGETEKMGPSTTLTSIPTTLTSIPASHYLKRTIPSLSLLSQLRSTSKIGSPHVEDHLLTIFGSEASTLFSIAPEPIWPDLGILLSASQSNEDAMELGPEKAGGTPYGAFTYAFMKVLEENKMPLSNKSLVTFSRGKLQAMGMTQHACLYCSTDEAARAHFLLQ